jgi:methyl-accepting chemotaxis protein
MSFKRKLQLLILIGTMTSMTLMSLISVWRMGSMSDAAINNQEKVLLTDYDSFIKTQVETVLNLISGLERRATNGELTVDDAKKQAADIVRKLRYGNENYFWIDTVEGINIAYLGKEIEGKSRIDQQDKKGSRFIHELIEKAKNDGGGYVDYWFPKPGNEVPLPKRGYALEFKPWGWVVGTGNYVDDIDTIVKKLRVDAKKDLNVNILIFCLSAIGTVIGGLIGGWWFTQDIINKIGGDPNFAVEIVNQVADGDLTVRFDVKGTGNSLLRSVQHLISTQRKLMAQIKASADSLALASYELNGTSCEMSNVTSEVVSQAVTVATAGEEMSATSSDIAANCISAAENAEHASRLAQEGAVVVMNTVAGMERIAVRVKETSQSVNVLGASSQKIGEIVNTIEDIADQTNLLALNAAIEAARAGDQGRGFAVVADEVRALAERTTKATQEISEMIKDIQKATTMAVSSMEEGVIEVGKGSADAARSGEALTIIIDKVNEVNIQISQIATAAEEQTATTREISNNVYRINEAVSGSARGVNELAIAAGSLSVLAEELKETVSGYQI